MVVALAGGFAVFIHRKRSDVRHAVTAGMAPGYAPAEACEACHPKIAATYRETGMGRSFQHLTAPEGELDAAKPFYHEASQSWFSVIRRDGKYYQRRWQVGFNGKKTNVDEKQIDFVMGSGNHARTYIHLTERDTLQELPLGWYAEKGGYFAMNPGYDRAEYKGSTRVIHYECMFCHNGYPQVRAGHEEPGAEAQYLQPLPEGIDCQRCHGPGQRHIDVAGTAGARPEAIRAAIVNPARLPPEREMEVCMACHLETTSRMLPHSLQKFDRGPFSWVPGRKLADFHLTFDRADGRNSEFEVAHHAYRLRKSRCFIESEGRLRCTTCHNPHDIPRGEAATTHYNDVCRSCHTGTSQPATAHGPGAKCTSCHMPRRRTDDAVHIVMTDHGIVRGPPPGDLVAVKSEKSDAKTLYRGEVVPYYPAKAGSDPESALYLALAQVTDRSNSVSGLKTLSGLLEKARPGQAGWYAAAGEAYRTEGNTAKGIAALNEATRLAPSSEILQLQLGNALIDTGQWAKAETALRRAKELRPDDGAAWGLLGWVLWQQDKKEEAKSSLLKGIRLNPEAPDLRNYLAALLTSTADIAGAEREFREAIRINPGVAEWHDNLAKFLASRGDVDEARQEFEESIRINPAYGPARLNYARLLANINQGTAAETQVRAAIASDWQVAAAHELLGYLLSAKNDLAGAVRELRLAIQLNPDTGRAHYELGLALGRMGNHAEAAGQLRMAAQGNDPPARSAAQEVLRRLAR